MISAVRFYGDSVEFSVKDLKIKIEFSFIFILCISLVFGYKNTGMLILFSMIHEFAHLAALLAVGGKAECLTVSFFGIALKYNSDLSSKQEFGVIAAGPAANLILFLVLKDEINLFLAVLNLLPVFPLDGGRLIKLFFPNAVRYVSAVFLVVMLLLSIYILLNFNVVSLLFICIYLIAFNVRSL